MRKSLLLKSVIKISLLSLFIMYTGCSSIHDGFPNETMVDDESYLSAYETSFPMEIELVIGNSLYIEKAGIRILLTNAFKSDYYEYNAEFVVSYFNGYGDSFVELSTGQYSCTYELENDSPFEFALKEVKLNNDHSSVIIVLNQLFHL